MTKNQYVRCDGCSRIVKSAGFGNPNAPDNGWHLPVKIFGYYGGFTDDILDINQDLWKSALAICHDCVVKMLSALPNKDIIEKGGHPCTDKKPCCDWAWKTVDGVVYGSVNNKWKALS